MASPELHSVIFGLCCLFEKHDEGDERDFAQVMEPSLRQSYLRAEARRLAKLPALCSFWQFRPMPQRCNLFDERWRRPPPPTEGRTPEVHLRKAAFISWPGALRLEVTGFMNVARSAFLFLCISWLSTLAN